MFPKNCVYMRWNYDMPESPGNIRAMKWFSDNGFNVMGATAGQTRWNLMPLDQSNTKNIRDFALISIRNKANGLLLTLWDDDSPHFELYQRGISIFAEYTWAGERSTDELHQAYRQRAFGPALASAENEFINALESPVADWKNMLLDNRTDRNSLRTIDDPINQAVIPFPNLDSAGAWSQKYQDKITKAEASRLQVDEVLKQIQFAKNPLFAIRTNLKCMSRWPRWLNFQIGRFWHSLNMTSQAERIEHRLKPNSRQWRRSGLLFNLKWRKFMAKPDRSINPPTTFWIRTTIGT